MLRVERCEVALAPAARALYGTATTANVSAGPSLRTSDAIRQLYHIHERDAPHVAECTRWSREHHVVSGESWGALSLHDQRRYKELGCDATLADERYHRIRTNERSDRAILRHAAHLHAIERDVLLRTFSGTNAATIATATVAVVVSWFREDVSWLALLPPETFALHVFTKPGGHQSLPPLVTKRHPTLRVYAIDYNYGDEATVYLEYVLRHYDLQDAFPPHVAFIHAHKTSWHTSTSMATLLVCFRYGLYPYMDLTFDAFRCLSPEAHRNAVANPSYYVAYLNDVLQPHYGARLRNVTQQTICNHCCGQFVVSRERILAVPKAVYQDTLRFFHTWHTHERRINPMENTWHMLFGEAPQVMKLNEYVH